MKIGTLTVVNSEVTLKGYEFSDDELAWPDDAERSKAIMALDAQINTLCEIRQRLMQEIGVNRSPVQISIS